MASFSYLLLPLLLLISITTFLAPAPALCYINPGASIQQTATHPSARRSYVVLVEPPSLDYDASEDEHRRWHESFLPASRTDSGEPRLIHSYTEVFSGFAARFTDAELEVVSSKSGFVRAFPDWTLQLMTTHTPEFLGLRNGSGFWSEAHYGKGVVVGLLDTGIHATHPSFNDDGVPPPPTRWKGSCEGSAARCNNKLIGAKAFVGRDSGDEEGHGTHTSSTAAGNFVGGASARGLGAGTTAGIAPGAHIAMYKVCNADGCATSDILAGLDAAIKDGVDVLSLSIGTSVSHSFDDDPIAIGAFSAVSKGIIVVCAAGNSGPSSLTVTNDAPWLLTVAAGSVDRSFHADVQLGNGKRIDGQALIQASNSNSKSYPLLYSEERRYCQYEGDGVVSGKIVVCEANDYAVQKSVIRDMRSAGAAGVVLINAIIEGYTTVLRDYGSSVVQVTAADGDNITDYATSASNSATITYNNTLLGIRPAPAVAFFSSRGPSKVTPGVLKPDVLAPGLNILAAWPPQAGGAAGPFNIISGTSMATPHASGVAALVKSSHPDWSPAAIKSAILTTSDAVDKSGGPILDEQYKKASAYATGAGHVNPTRAADPGLVYDLGVTDYVGYLCDLLGDDASAIAAIVRNSSLTCAKLPKIPEAQLNYPTITVPLKSTPFTVNRTVTNVGPAESTYTLKLDVPKSLTVRVSPETLVFSKAGEKNTFSVTVSGHREDGHEAVEGSLSWVSGKYVVRSPVVAVFGLEDPPPSSARVSVPRERRVCTRAYAFSCSHVSSIQ